MSSFIETASLCTILEQLDNYFWSYFISKIGGYKCHHETPLSLYLVSDNFVMQCIVHDTITVSCGGLGGLYLFPI